MSNESIHKELARGIIQYIENRRDEKLEKFLSEKPNKNKKGDITNGAINFRISDFLNKYLKEHDRQNSLDELVVIDKLTKPKEVSKLEFQLDKFKQYWELLIEELPEEALSLKSELDNFINKNNEAHMPINWLNEWTPKAKDISFATHVAKLTHPSARGSCVLDKTRESLPGYLCTSDLKSPHVDVAVSNAASNPIGDVLTLSSSGVSLLDLLKRSDELVLELISNDSKLTKEWEENLRNSFQESKLKSHFLNKQVYFKIDSNSYHLVLPLVSTSLAQKIYEKVQAYYNDEQGQARKFSSEGKFYDGMKISYPDLCVLSVTDNPKSHISVSQLNNERKGELSLFSCSPPQWNSKLPSYKNKNSLFDRGLSARLDDGITELRNYLLVLKNKELSLSKPQRNAAIKGKLSNIIAEFFDFVLIVNSNENERGWTMSASLPLQQQLLLEPWREDDEVRELLSNNLWQAQLSKDFGRWLNNQLKTKKKGSLQLTPIHEAIWSSWFLIELKEHVALQEAMQ